MVDGLHRVVITGLGAVTPIGNTVQDYWNGLTSGSNGVDAITLFDASAHACRFAAEVKDFDPSGFIEPKEAKRWDRFCKFGVVAAKQAVAHAGLEINDANADRIGTIIGSGVGGLLTMETQAHVLEGKGPGRVSPFTVPMMIPNMATGLAAIALGTKGPSSAVATACAAGSNAVGDAFRLLQLGKADAMVCGGAESAITPLGVAGFASAKALSFRNDDPATASRPFDKERDGFVIGEGAGVLVLETLEHAQARGATILGEVVGYGMTCDAHHITSPTPGGVGGAEAMRLALADDNACGIAAAQPGATLGDVGHAIQSFVEANRFSVVRDFCGHGLGQIFHTAPSVLHYGTPGTGVRLRPGMFFTIEPMVNAGKFPVKLLDDGWTAVTRDRSLSAQFEHSLAITDDGHEIFTLSPTGLHKPSLEN